MANGISHGLMMLLGIVKTQLAPTNNSNTTQPHPMTPHEGRDNKENW
jgi:hypothetical protein